MIVISGYFTFIIRIVYGIFLTLHFQPGYYWCKTKLLIFIDLFCKLDTLLNSFIMF